MRGRQPLLQRHRAEEAFRALENRCAFPSCEELLSKPEWPKVLAKVCHICGLNAGSARHVPQMTDLERNDYPNLILLCPNHHELIDELEPERWGVDDLYDMKMAHEKDRPGDRDWCTGEMAQQFVLKLALAQGLMLLARGQPPPREPIVPAPHFRNRSGRPRRNTPVHPFEAASSNPRILNGHVVQSACVTSQTKSE